MIQTIEVFGVNVEDAWNVISEMEGVPFIPDQFGYFERRTYGVEAIVARNVGKCCCAIGQLIPNVIDIRQI